MDLLHAGYASFRTMLFKVLLFTKRNFISSYSSKQIEKNSQKVRNKKETPTPKNFLT